MTEGLRERSRIRRRARMERIATRLFTENGYEATTLVQIAEEADVSTRTLTLYFPTKLDLALAYSTAASQRLDTACQQRQPGTSVVDVVHTWLADEVNSHREQLQGHAAMLAANPVLRGSETPAITAARLAVTREFATDLGSIPNNPAVVLATGALIGLISATLDAGTTDADLHACVHVATAYANAIVEQAHRLAGESGDQSRPSRCTPSS